MLSLFPKLRFPWIALLAILGIALLGQGTAQACGSKPVAAKRSCCPAGAPAGCGACCDSSPSNAVDSSLGVERHEGALPLAQPVTTPLRHCECRSQAPSAPSSKPETEQTQRSEESSTEVVSLPVDDLRPAHPLRWNTSASPSPPRTPLYLRVARLLI